MPQHDFKVKHLREVGLSKNWSRDNFSELGRPKFWKRQFFFSRNYLRRYYLITNLSLELLHRFIWAMILPTAQQNLSYPQSPYSNHSQWTFSIKNYWIFGKKVFNSGLSKFCGRQPLKSSNRIFLKYVSLEIYLVHSWILCLVCHANCSRAVFSFAMPSSVIGAPNEVCLKFRLNEVFLNI